MSLASMVLMAAVVSVASVVTVAAVVTATTAAPVVGDLMMVVVTEAGLV